MATQADDAVPVEEIVECGTSTTWLLINTGIVLLVVHQLYNFSYFWRMGVPGPVPLPFIGHYMQFGKGVVPAYRKWFMKYGNYFGIYLGSNPTLLISDPELARHILIKDFASFQSRQIKSFSVPYLADSILETSSEVWKRGRSYISPTFSGSKLKHMVADINSKCDILLEVLAEKTKGGESINMKDDMSFPESSLEQVPMFDILPLDSIEFFNDIVKKTIGMRQDGATSGKKDFLQLMIDAAEAGGEDPDGGDIESTKPRKKIALTQRELIGQSLLFFFAGYETVAATTSFVTYATARYPEIQKKLHEEVDEFTSEGEVKYEDVPKMEYLDKVWCEAQRMWPIALWLERNCTTEFTYNGRTIPEGQYINLNVWNIHYNPEYWPNPKTFDPENFSKEAKENRKPCTYMPFGNGLRNCVAMRFALLQGKISLARILQKYTLELDP